MMAFAMLFSLSLILSSKLLTNGQCTTENCSNRFAESDKSFEDKFHEHDQKLNQVYNDLYSRLQEIQAADKVLAMERKEQSESLENILTNISSRLDGIEIIPKSADRCLTSQEMLKFSSLQKNLSFEFSKTGENLAREFDQKLNSIRQDFSLRLQTVEGLLKELNESREREQGDIDQKLQTVFHRLSTKHEGHSQSLANILSNISSGLDGIEVTQAKSADRSLTNEQMLNNLQKNVSLEFTKMGENLARQFSLNLNSIYQNVSLKLERVEGLLKECNDSREREHEDIDEKLQTVFHNLSTKHEEILQQLKSKDYCQEKSQEVCDCSDIKASGFTTSEVYRIYVIVANKRHYANAYCDMTTANNSWIIFQRRKDGSENFYRGWRDYEKGFGDPNGEYWLGNEFLHILTSKRRYRLRVDMEDFEGEKRYADYLGFNIKSSEYNYTMTVGSYSGNAGNSLAVHNNMQFSTFDFDNINNCAAIFRGAWWYENCHASNLNGRYLRGNHSSYADGINWSSWRGHHYSLKTTEMKLAPLN